LAETLVVSFLNIYVVFENAFVFIQIDFVILIEQVQVLLVQNVFEVLIFPCYDKNLNKHK